MRISDWSSDVCSSDLFTETAGGTTVGVLKKLVETGQLDTSPETVVINTGHGLKTLAAISDRVGARATIAPSYAAFVAAQIICPPQQRNPMSVSLSLPTIPRTYTGRASQVSAPGETRTEERRRAQEWARRGG